MEKASETKNRVPYRKPRLEKVPLRPEEAVLGSCKVLGGGTGPDNPCGTEQGAGACVGLGGT